MSLTVCCGTIPVVGRPRFLFPSGLDFAFSIIPPSPSQWPMVRHSNRRDDPHGLRRHLASAMLHYAYGLRQLPGLES